MKNIHVLPTPNSSRLSYNENGVLKLNRLQWRKGTQNIYITSDEEIKEGDWFMSDFNSFPLHNIKELSEREGTLGWKQKDLKNNLKIILTTDQDLTKDGVQAIDDEFLEWFVKNPSCEEVEVKRGYLGMGGFVETAVQHRYFDETKIIFRYHYEIIIPKEEPKQETLEEVADRLYPYEVGYGVFDRNCEIDIERERFVEGAKWQQEQDMNKYGKEDLKQAFNVGFNVGYNDETSPSYLTFEKWFEQIKKK